MRSACRSCSTSSRTSTTCKRSTTTPRSTHEPPRSLPLAAPCGGAAPRDGSAVPRMKVLVVGSGGREHALAWKLVQSPKVQTVYVAPGNGGTGSDVRLHNIAITDFDALADFVVEEKIALTVVGPEAPLAAGIVDRFRA